MLPRAALAAALLASAASLLAQAAIPQQLPQTNAPPPVTGSKAHAAGQGPTTGRALFEEKCAMCHGAGGMGTGLLARRMDPAVAELEKRDDLTVDYVTQAARAGIGNMPAISRAEVSDPQMASIAGYLTKGAR